MNLLYLNFTYRESAFDVSTAYEEFIPQLWLTAEVRTLRLLSCEGHATMEHSCEKQCPIVHQL